MDLNPKELRAQAKYLLELARMIEASQDLNGYMQKQMKRKIAAMKRKAKYDAIKSIIK